MNPRKRLRSLMQEPDRIIQTVGAHNALGAKLVEQHGFDAVWASGFEISTAHAKPDANILTMVEFLEAARQMTDATHLPIIADCDTGFGNVNNVIRMVRDYEKAGIAAVCIEDKVFPKMNSFIPGFQTLAPKDEFSAKIRAAKDTQRDPDFVVIARVESLIAGHGMEESLERAAAYEEAGADLILIHSKQKDPGEIFEFSRRWNSDTPLVIVPTTYPSITLTEMIEHNVKMVIYANQALRAAVKAMNQVLAQLKESGSLLAIQDQLSPMDQLFELQGLKDMIKQEEQYRRQEVR
ncbi:phosphoenolpyruvate mutase [Tumebacillus algifaecis]|uniref:phosphoenolpyruvate mutase n=1 Tax=Tumebacillus algifaecis TaxID=1214604 RepID=A0A223D262_9BACL|nr:phosphoenolpyruvate mutase [Tumebacillus algifaecis]ASS75474.1 phosphoenolpyruvate mutase [Tumebacillus algifaecis]